MASSPFAFMNGGLARGQNVSLTRENPSLRSIVVSISWDTNGRDDMSDALGMAAVLCGADGKVSSDRDLVYFNQVISADTSVESVGATGGAKEQIEVDLDRVPATLAKIVFALYSDAGLGTARSLRRLKSCRVSVADLDTSKSITSTVDLADEMGDETATLLGEVYRHDGGWKFRCIGQGYTSGLVGAMKSYGVAL